LHACRSTLEDPRWIEVISAVIIVTAGSMIMMWLGEAINEKGVGNGVSLIIFSGIVSGLPVALSGNISTFSPEYIPYYMSLITFVIILIGLIVYITEAERRIPITYAKQATGFGSSGLNSSYLPIRLNQAGVMPIIFAVSVLLFPQIATQLLSGSDNIALQTIANTLNVYLGNPIIYSIIYFLLVVLFTYFYTAINFDPEKTAEKLQKQGAFLSGHRPGESTGYRARIRNHGHSCFLCEIVIRSQFHTTYEPEA
jgi:Preprotein translocase subunit SecY